MKFDCCLCDRKEIETYPHNPQPIMEGDCCGECNNKFVIPTRIMEMHE